MTLNLLKHNAKVCYVVTAMLLQYGKVAVVHPTGIGESCTAFKLMDDRPDAIVLWMSPGDYTFKPRIKVLKLQECEFFLVNMCFYTYAKLLGLMVANIRHLDNNNDMAQQRFGGHIASEMTLGEAIARGIWLAPRHLTTVDLEADEEFTAFKTERSDLLKLLFCIDMPDKGVRAEDVSDVILFRSTTLTIIYKQQVGRALMAGTTSEPLILDEINGFNSQMEKLRDAPENLTPDQHQKLEMFLGQSERMERALCRITA